MNRPISLFLPIILFVVCVLPCTGKTSKPHYLDLSHQFAEFYVDSEVNPSVHTALSLVLKDIEQVFGAHPKVHYQRFAAKKYPLKEHFSQAFAQICVRTDTTWKAWEAFRLEVYQGNLYITGSDPRGTAYGLLELSKLMGVSPWAWWADAQPEKLDRLMLPKEGYLLTDQPSVTYRGIFLNDEDWGLMPWATKTLDPNSSKGAIGPAAYERIFQLMLRLRINTLWPAMHECTKPFFTITGNREMAERYGIVVGTSHCEPLLRNSATEWDQLPRGDYNFKTNRDSVLHYWQQRVAESSSLNAIYTLGMRGKHDGMMEGAKTISEQLTLLSEILPAQRKILNETLGKPIEEVPQVFVPYKEVLDAYENGLKVPDDVTLLWCDDNYGYLSRLSNREEQLRKGGAGVYYHISYWGRPHDYLWLASTQPALLYEEMLRAWNHNAQKMWILNVGDIKPAEFLIEYYFSLAWRMKDLAAHPTENDPEEQLKAFLNREFGESLLSSKGAQTCSLNDSIATLYQEYYRLASIRKPEFMGWSRVEEAGAPKGRTPIKASEFTLCEIQQRLASYQHLSTEAQRFKKIIPARSKDAYFQLVEYPLRAAAAMNEKWLYAELGKSDSSLAAYDTIQSLTQHYNTQVGGKWNRMMDMQPRKLYVFEKPDFSRRDSTQQIHPDSSVLHRAAPQLHLNALDCCDSTHCFVFRGLGHHKVAIRLDPHKGRLVYRIPITQPVAAKIRVALIPTHSAEGESHQHALQAKLEKTVTSATEKNFSTTSPCWNLPFGVVGRSEQWKQNVLSNQAVVEFTYSFETSGEYLLTLSSEVSDVIIDDIEVNYASSVR